MDSLIDKVRKGLECHKDEIPGVCGKCPYFTESGFCSGRLAKDALELLKEHDEKLKEYEKLSKTLFKIDKFFRIKDLEFLVDGIENGSIVVLQDDGHFIGETPINETTIKIRRL